jgi:hypothetical protein
MARPRPLRPCPGTIASTTAASSCRLSLRHAGDRSHTRTCFCVGTRLPGECSSAPLHAEGAKAQQPVARARAGQRLEVPGRSELESSGLRQELVDRALDEAILRRAIGEASDGARISDQVIDELFF